MAGKEQVGNQASDAELEWLRFQRRLQSMGGPPLPPDPFGRPPVAIRDVEEALRNSHAAMPSNRELRRGRQ